ncbi:MAG: alpha/beta hydrolase domain-containing protein [Acidimicrobiales bacterium]
MAVDHFEIKARQDYGTGYERLDAIVHYALDPGHPANAAVVDLELAPRDADGKVRFQGDLTVLRPKDVADSSGRLLGWVTNRGRNALLPFSVPPPGFVPRLSPEIEPGNGFLLGRGWTVALLGWQWDVQRVPGLLGLDAPLAVGATTAVTIQFQTNTGRAVERLAHWPWHPDPRHMDAEHQPYPAADLHEATATMTVADHLMGSETTLHRDAWHFVDRTHVALDGGFEPGKVYRVTYTTDRCPIAGVGLTAVRDTMSYLRHTGPDGMDGMGVMDGMDGMGGMDGGEQVIATYGAGVSQTGRYLREFLHGGFNVDEEGRQVFDGLQIQVAGARRGEFNIRGAQPSAQYLPAGPTAAAPYRYQDLLRTQRERGGVPRIVHIDSASEYWRSDAYLVHGEDPLPAEVRGYLMAGTQHFPGMATLSDRPYPMPEVQAANALNTVNHAPLLRSSLLILDRWVSEGVEPPPSNVPRIGEGTAAERTEVLAAVGSVAALASAPSLPSPDMLIGTCPVVAAVGPDGNELAGIRLPEVAIPLGVQAGWNTRGPTIGGVGQPLDMAGSMLPYNTVAPLEEHLERVRQHIAQLMADGWLLEEDRPGALAAARRLHGHVAGALASLAGDPAAAPGQ